jgi:hypothetical protein
VLITYTLTGGLASTNIYTLFFYAFAILIIFRNIFFLWQIFLGEVGDGTGILSSGAHACWGTPTA